MLLVCTSGRVYIYYVATTTNIASTLGFALSLKQVVSAKGQVIVNSKLTQYILQFS